MINCCERDSILKGLSDLFANPQSYAITLHNDLLWFGDRDIVTHRYADHIVFGSEERKGNIFIAVTELATSHWRGLFATEPKLLHGLLTLSANHHIRSIRHREYMISADTMIYTPSAEGEPLAEYLSREPNSAAQLYDAIDRLEQELRQCDCYFDLDNFAAEKIFTTEDGRLYPQSLSRLSLDAGASPRQCCNALREWVHALSGVKLPYVAPKCQTIPFVEPEPMAVKGHIWCGTPHEERIAVLDESGYGFVDVDNHVIVASQYRSVTSFKEGRSVVESDRGYGLINVWGEYILDDIFEDMSYDESSGVTTAKLNGNWIRYNYMGKELENI